MVQAGGGGLFLDIEGAFPNAVTEQLLYNLRACCIPEVYVTFIKNMLTGRHNRLKFDDYVSDWFKLDNGIVQGDPLLMIPYLFYNADMLDIAHGCHELCLGYVDDMALIASVDTFENAHRMLGNMMSRLGGSLQWAAEHNLKFETSKSVLIDFSRAKGVGRLDMSLRGSLIKPSTSHKFLGVQLDQELRWKRQADYALGKASKWMLAFRRLARMASGVNLRLMWRLYHAVTILKMTYAVDVWYTPLHRKEGAKKDSGSVGITNKLVSLQRMAALAITGALHSTATDVLDLHAGTQPVRLLLHRLCRWAALWIASLPDTHPLHTVYCTCPSWYIKTH